LKKDYQQEWALSKQKLALPLHMAIDDTTVGRSGKHVAHAGWFKDAWTSQL
jgi:hypothetical protein